MNLSIDIGNSAVKCALFDGSAIFKICAMRRLSKRALANFLNGYGAIECAIVANVRSNSTFSAYLKIIETHASRVLTLSADTPLPLRICYKTPHTLGADRLAAAVGANALYPQRNILIISAGTALTFDLITNGGYIGGGISLGLRMRYKALHRFTAKLPLCAPTADICAIGQSTAESIIAGVQNGMLYEIQSTISHFAAQYSPLQTLLTGGDAAFFEDAIPNANVVQHLVMMGLNEIADYQQTN